MQQNVRDVKLLIGCAVYCY